MKILAIETATEACSAALGIDDDCRVRYEVAPRKHTELILPMVDELLSEADISLSELDAIAFGQGPGAFTGVRIAIGVTQGLAFAHDLPVIPVSSLAALAQGFTDKHDFVATAFDARIQEVYWGLYKKDEQGLMREIIDNEVCSPDEVTLPEDNTWFGIGSGWNTYADKLSARMNDKVIGFDGAALPSASDVLVLAKSEFKKGNTISVEQALPNYIRNKVVS